MLFFAPIFFFSGAASLVFETLWLHQAGLTFGNSVWASSLVLASFMGGLALGNVLSTRIGSTTRPLRLYAALEASVGVLGVGLVHFFPHVTTLLAPAFAPLLDHPAELNALRSTVAFVLLLVPTTAMGATLPLVVRALAGEATFGRVLGYLYGVNTLGGLSGALAAEQLVAAIGINGASWAAASANLAAAIATWLIAPWLAPRTAGPQPEQQAGGAGSAPRAGLGLAGVRVLAAAFLCGAILLGLEVCWVRYLVLFVHSVSGTFAAMLAVVLGGIGLGGAGAGRYGTTRRPTALLAIAAGALVVASYALLAPTPRVDGWLLPLAVPLMFPVSLLSGALFDLLGAELKDVVDDPLRATGLLTLANTLGAMAGALATGFALLPAAGVEGALFVLAAGYGVVAVVIGFGVWQKPALGALAVLAVLLATFPFGRMTAVHLPAALAAPLAKGERIVDVKEGTAETVVYLVQELLGKPLFWHLATNSDSMAANHVTARRYMKSFVYLPVALHPGMRDALLISFGLGSTARALIDTPELEHIDVVDINADVLAESALVNGDHDPLRDPRVRSHVEDGRFFLQTTPNRYDLITAEPPPPKNRGVVNLYTRDYFELLRDRLKDGGMVSYWLPVHQLTLADTAAITRAFCDAFPDCSLWGGSGLDWTLLGQRGTSTRVSPERFRAQWNDARAVELAELGFEQPEQLGALFIGDAGWLRAQAGEPVTDDFPYRLAPDARIVVPVEQYRALMDANAARDRFAHSAFIAKRFPPELIDGTLAMFDAQGAIDAFSLPRMLGHDLNDQQKLALLDHLLATTKLRWPVIRLLDSDPDALRIIDGTTSHDFDEDLTARAFADRDYATAARLLPEHSVLRAYAVAHE